MNKKGLFISVSKLPINCLETYNQNVNKKCHKLKFQYIQPAVTFTVYLEMCTKSCTHSYHHIGCVVLYTVHITVSALIYSHQLFTVQK